MSSCNAANHSVSHFIFQHLENLKPGFDSPPRHFRISEISYLLLPSRDKAEIPLKQCKSSIQPTNQSNIYKLICPCFLFHVNFIYTSTVCVCQSFCGEMIIFHHNVDMLDQILFVDCTRDLIMMQPRCVVFDFVTNLTTHGP